MNLLCALLGHKHSDSIDVPLRIDLWGERQDVIIVLRLHRMEVCTRCWKESLKEIIATDKRDPLYKPGWAEQVLSDAFRTRQRCPDPGSPSG